MYAVASLELTVVRCGKSTIAWVLCVSRVSIIRVDLFGISADPTSKSAPPLSMIGSLRGVVSTRPSGCARELERKAFGDTETRSQHAGSIGTPSFSSYIVSCITNSGIGSGWGAGVSLCQFPDSFLFLYTHTHANRTTSFYDPLFSVQREEANFHMVF